MPRAFTEAPRGRGSTEIAGEDRDAMTVFTQRRIRAAFAAIAARASRLCILVVRQSLPRKPNSRRASETHNTRSSLPWPMQLGPSARSFYVSLHSANPIGSNFWERQHGARLMPRLTQPLLLRRHGTRQRRDRSPQEALRSRCPTSLPHRAKELASVVAACAGNKKPRLGGRGLVTGNVRRKPDLVVGESDRYLLLKATAGGRVRGSRW
jgi:hypothetical protein